MLARARRGMVFVMNNERAARFRSALLSFALAAAAAGCASQPTPQSASPTTSASDPTPTSPSVLVTPEMGSPHMGQAAPDFDLIDQNGAHVKLSSLRGSVVVLAFVASYCPFSEAAQPHLAELA